MASISELRSSKGDKAKPAREHDFSVEVVTPAIAKEWLALNLHNRKASKRMVNRYMRDILGDGWAFCGDPIRFNGDGELIDGQHRLMAIEKSGKSIDCLIIRGLAKSVGEKIDQGYGRRASDHLYVRGITSSSIRLAAAARFLWWLKHKDNWRAIGMPTNWEVLSLIDRHPQLVESVEGAPSKMIGMHASMAAAFHYIGSHLLDDVDTADAFITVLTSGENAYDGDPLHLWRERLVAHMDKKTHLPVKRQRLGTIHAWNTFRKHEPLKQFKIPDDCAIDGLDVDKI